MWKVPCDSQYHTAVPTRHNCTQSDQRSAHPGRKIRSLGPVTIFVAKVFFNFFYLCPTWMVSTRTVCEFLSSNQTSPGDKSKLNQLKKTNEWYTLYWGILKDFFSGVVLVNSKKREKYLLLKREMMNPVIWNHIHLHQRLSTGCQYSGKGQNVFWVPEKNFEEYSHLNQLGPFLILALFV